MSVPTPSRLPGRLTSREDERGAVAVIVTLVVVVLFASAALAVDTASQMMTRQDLHNVLDYAAHAGAYELPDNGKDATAKALAVARANDASLDPTVDLWCVVASTGATKTVKTAQIPGTCNPGPAPYTAAVYSGLRCNTKLCAIPCDPDQGDVCNTVRVSDSKAVPYSFAPVVGITEGSTGGLSSSACKGTCGTETANPMDVVVVADRTASMSATDRAGMVSGIKAMLQTLDPRQQYVALATIHKSKTPAPGCATTSTASADGVQGGTWVPVGFSSNYQAGPAVPPALPALNAASPLVAGLTCLPESQANLYGTHLTGAMKGAARYLLGYATNNLSSLPARTGTVRKVIIFETDGMPDEVFKGGSTTLTTSSDVGAGLQESNGGTAGNGVLGCKNLQTVAQQAKAAGILIVTIGFGQAAFASCTKGTTSKPYVRDYLAAVASPTSGGAASVADNDCSTSAERILENGDGDFYYCAASGAELQPIFAAAINAVSGSIRLIEQP